MGVEVQIISREKTINRFSLEPGQNTSVYSVIPNSGITVPALDIIPKTYGVDIQGKGDCIHLPCFHLNRIEMVQESRITLPDKVIVVKYQKDLNIRTIYL